MFSMIVPNEIETATQDVYWAILTLFFVLAILSWLTIGKNWFQDNTTAPKNSEEAENIPLDSAE